MPEDYAIKDSGERRGFSTGSVRDRVEGKGRYDLIPWEWEEALALHLEVGAEKYGDDNWKKGQPLSVYINSWQRHLNKVKRGLRDERHAVASAWNALAFYWTVLRIEDGKLPRELDDIGYCKPEELNDV